MTENKRFVQNTNLVMQNNEVYVVCGDEHSADVVTTALNELINENEQLKEELKKYTDAFDCSQCRFQNYDWFDDGDEFEVCDKGNNEAQMYNHSCSEWEEL